MFFPFLYLMCWFWKLGLLHKVCMTCLLDPSKHESNMFARSKTPGLGVGQSKVRGPGGQQSPK
jgi:hypothetical protein